MRRSTDSAASPTFGYRTLTVLMLCAVALVAGAHVARAAGVVGTGTAAGCTDAALDTALSGGGVVTFNCGGPVTIDISAGTGTKAIIADTTIDGGGLVTVSGGNSVRVFSVPDAVSFRVKNLTIAHGLDRFSGGGIYNLGTLTVTNSTFFANGAAAGGGIYNAGLLDVANSTFTDNFNNQVSGGGGGIFNSGLLTVANGTFISNHGLIGGGINNQGTLTVTSSTFTANSAAFVGGSIAGPGLLRSTIVVSSPARDNCASSITDGGHNLDDGTSCGFGPANGSMSNTDAQLEPAGLQDNGGPTQTVALCTGVGMPAGCTAASPAIGAGDPVICAAAPVNNRDQRGFMRPGRGHTQCSIGAYEADAIAAQACVGDCDRTGQVTIDELVTLVGIALGNSSMSACTIGDVNHDGEITVDEIIIAVNLALGGCL